MSAGETIDIALCDVAPTPLAAVRRTTRRADLGRTIVSSLDVVYALLRARGAEGLGQNVVVYRAATGWSADDTLDIEVGVQTPSPIEPDGEVLALASPSGRAATAIHIGPYQTIPVTNQAIRRWMTERGLRWSVDWEVYGDWSDDAAKLATKIFFLVQEGDA